MADQAASPDDSRVILAVDQGTSSTKAIVVDALGAVIATTSVAVSARHPRAGWVEQDAVEILESVRQAIDAVCADLGDRPVAGIGLSSQRESAVIWDRHTGEPLGPLLGWQDRRTVARAQDVALAGHADLVRELTGLPVDPMFSALKLGWLLDQVDPDRSRSHAGEIAAGTVDSWLLFRLTGEHRIEAGNASRTQLLNLETVDWDDRLLKIFGVPREVLPDVTASDAPSAPVRGINSLPPTTRVLAVLGDSHSALYAHGVREPGAVKVTYGTGSSIMGLLAAGQQVDPGLVTTIAWCTDSPQLGFEGNILSSGSTMVWLAGFLGTTPAALFALGETASAEHGVDLVPAFAGLGAPWWDEGAQASLSGLTLGTTPHDVARAAIESIALQVEDVLSAADAAGSSRIGRILVDGGPSANDWLMQLQADLSQRIVERPVASELSARGVAYLAGTVAGLWGDEQMATFSADTSIFRPGCDPDGARRRRESWLTAVARSRSSPSTSPREATAAEPALRLSHS